MIVHWGQKLRELTERKGYKYLKDVALGIGESPQNLSNWCGDPYPDLENLEKVLKFLNVSLSDFFKTDNDLSLEYEFDPLDIQIMRSLYGLNVVDRERIRGAFKDILITLGKETQKQ